MKMSAASFELLKAALDEQATLCPSAVRWTKANHKPKRYRWDRFNALPNWRELSSRFYAEGLNDTHIDTALRRAV